MNLVLAYGALLTAGILIDAGAKGDTIANVIKGQATAHPIGNPGATGGGSSTPAGMNLPAGTYTNPVPGASASRIDMGGDYTLSEKGFVAPGRSKIVQAVNNDPYWAGGGKVVAQLLDGPLAGTYYYVAEGVRPAVRVGQEVAAGTPLVVRTHSPYNGTLGNIEAGFADASGQPLAKSTGGYQEGWATAAGAAWNSFVHSLGGVADHANTAIHGHVSGVLASL